MEVSDNFDPVRTAVFPVGGLGTRFLPATKSMPKEMLPIVDKPLIQYAVEEAKAAGIERFIFVTGRGKSAIEDHFDHSRELADILIERDKVNVSDQLKAHLLAPGSVAYTRQQESLGLGHAVWCARHLVGHAPFAVLLADDLILGSLPCLSQMQAVYTQYGGNVVAAMDVPLSQVSQYGVVRTQWDNGTLAKVSGLIEKPSPDQAPSRLCVIGRYILDPVIFEYLGEHKTGIHGEIQLTDSMARMIGQLPFHAMRFQGDRYDCGSKNGFLQANIAYALSRDDLRADLLDFMGTLIDIKQISIP